MALARAFRWKSEGRDVLPTEMTDTHLRNTLLYLWDACDVLEAEARRRGMRMQKPLSVMAKRLRKPKSAPGRIDKAVRDRFSGIETTKRNK